ncbi:uncharacterized protein LOC119735219 [Patiria miniata]|uniref:CCHC-type domain-containing protein n=1 Tax=Patiria miniata TaxID=46514 RepID=A0A914AN51_PATMI|nr:uncharacterized protein LOC119735219 [Patiria miniata]
MSPVLPSQDFEQRHHPFPAQCLQGGVRANKRRYYARLGAKSKPCYRCGKGNHHSDKCRFKNNTCFNCQKRGHIASVCISGKGGKTPHVKQMSSAVDSNFTESDENASDVDMITPVYSLFGCSTDRQGMKAIKVTMSVDNNDLVMKVDTGAALSLVSEQTFKSRWPNANLQKTKLKLRTYIGEQVSVLGNFNVEVDYNARMFNLPLLVVKGDGPNLLGRNWLQTGSKSTFCTRLLVLRKYSKLILQYLRMSWVP